MFKVGPCSVALEKAEGEVEDVRRQSGFRMGTGLESRYTDVLSVLKSERIYFLKSPKRGKAKLLQLKTGYQESCYVS